MTFVPIQHHCNATWHLAQATPEDPDPIGTLQRRAVRGFRVGGRQENINTPLQPSAIPSGILLPLSHQDHTLGTPPDLTASPSVLTASPSVFWGHKH